MVRIPVLLLALSAGILAQEPAPLPLTLRDAVGLALQQNPQVMLANLGVFESEQDRLLARAALLPQVSGNVAESAHRVNLQTAIGLSLPGFPQHVGPFEVFQGGAAFNVAVFDLTLWRRYRSSRIGVEASRAEETAAREESVLLVVSQYLGSQRAAADIQAAQSRVDLAQALYDQAADLQRNGVGTGIDSLRANVQLQNEKQRLIVAHTQLETSLYGLARLLNIDPRRTIRLADQMSFFATPEVSRDEALERAYSARPEMRQILAEEQRALLEEKSAGDERLPKIAVGGVWLEQGLNPATIIPVYQYQASLDFPLFTGGRIQAGRAKAGLAIRQLKQQEQDLLNRIALEVKTAMAQMESARSEVSVANLGVQLARQEVEQARDRFQAGVANNIETVTAQDELARAQDNQIAALYRYNQSRAGLARAVGQMEALYGK
ncbi:MAG: TolC family protein [Acidobacteriia bacterium]|nr:TolC family protein [Terriglobia bacterium]